MRNFFRKISPNFLLVWFRKQKKQKKNKALIDAKSKGNIITLQKVISDLKTCGIQPGDDLLVHSSLSSIGYVQNGAETVINALLKVVGEKGNLLMPSSPNAFLQLNYIQNLKVFDVLHTPSALGSITEIFRTKKGVLRSEHPTEPVCCYGPNSMDYTGTHFGELTPYTKKSPFYKLVQNKGKILYLGVTLDNAGTSLHLLEDAVSDFKFPIYYDVLFNVDVLRSSGEKQSMKTYVHNPDQSKKRKCDQLIPSFEKAGFLKKVKIGNAPSLILDASKMYHHMLNQYQEKGVTMYTPFGS
ncbi:MAG: AAC(3) family N-acetyltransferase [Crocinitomicaceae bacterium]|nr:AAC(3) family N-acetyltransferase [Crocinitomicaceae bacterium]